MENGKLKTVNGILLVDKPTNISSFGVVARVRGIIKAEAGQKIKIGHTGTLDPAASGLMILVLGKYTKRASEFSKLDKVYQAELTLGATSSTGDREGQITDYRSQSSEEPTKKAVEAVLGQFEGEILQTPPKYSAVKIDGQRAYKLARAGKTVEIEPRKVKIYPITDVNYDYPNLKFTVKVSSGTYIRSLAEDIGVTLGTGAYLSALRRTQVGDFGINKSVELDSLDFSAINEELRDIPNAATGLANGPNNRFGSRL